MIGRLAAPVFRHYAELLEAEVDDLAALDQELTAAHETIRAERDEVCGLLAAVYLPALTQDALNDAEARTGYRGFRQRKPLEAYPREAKQLRARIAKLEADERWQRREALVGQHGSLTRALAEANDMLEPWQRDCAQFEDLEGFTELVAIGYDTPAFEERWWQPSYWRHWAQGDRICKALGMDDFGDDVLPAYEKVSKPRDKWRAEVERIQGNVDAVHQVLRERDAAVWRLEHLAEIYLEESRKMLGQHLLAADAQLLATWAADDRGVIVHLKRLSGLGAKLDFLDEMRNQWVRPSRDLAVQARAKMLGKVEKLQRPKKASTYVNMPLGFEEKVQRRAERREKARASLRRIVRYRDYERFDLGQPPETWWVHMHDGRRPGVFTPGLRGWYDRHPDVTVIVDADWDDGRGDVFAASQSFADAGDIS